MSAFLNSRHTQIYSMSLELIMASKCISFFLNRGKKQYFGERGGRYLLFWQLLKCLLQKKDSSRKDGDSVQLGIKPSCILKYGVNTCFLSFL